MEGTGKQDDLNDAPMTDAGSVDPVDAASEDLGADSSATDDPMGAFPVLAAVAAASLPNAAH
eukprot:7685156-Lingulodinium_polyedra.AAC.1